MGLSFRLPGLQPRFVSMHTGDLCSSCLHVLDRDRNLKVFFFGASSAALYHNVIISLLLLNQEET